MIINRPMKSPIQDHGGAAPGTSQDGTDPGKTNPAPATAPDGKAPQDQAGSESQTKGSDEPPDDPAELKARLKKGEATLKEMREKFEARALADEKAAQTALRDQGKFKELYEQAAPKLELLNRYDAVIGKMLEAELKTIPESLKGLLPDGDPVAQLDWIARAREAGAIQQQGKPRGTGDGSPPPATSGKVMTLEEFNRKPTKERTAFLQAGGTVSE
jgi:hypothetical protein